MDNTRPTKLNFIHSILLRIFPSSLRERLEHQYDFIKILKNVGWLFADKLIQLSLGILVGAWVARYLGPSNFGELAYVIAIVGIFQTISQLGINNIAVRDLANEESRHNDIIGTLFRLRMYSGLFCFVCVIALVYLMHPTDHSLLLAIIIAGGLIFQPSEVVDLWFQSNLQSKRTVRAKFIVCIISNTIKVIFILMEMPLIAFALIILLESIIFATTLLYSYHQTSKVGYGKWNTNLCKQMLTEGFPFLVSGLLLVAYIQLDKVFLVKLGSVTEAGYYTAAIVLTSAINFFPMIICSSLAPFLARLKTNEDRNNFFIKLYSFLFWTATFFSILLFFSAQEIILLLYDYKYLNSILVVKLLALSIIPVFLSVSNDYLALSRRSSKITLIRTAIGLIINLTLNIALIPHYGAAGTAFAILVTHWISNTILYWLIVKDAFSLQLKGLIFPLTLINNKNKLQTRA